MADNDKSEKRNRLLKPVLEKREQEFMEGLKAILDDHHDEDLQALARWPGELSDPDSARMISSFESSVVERNQHLLEELKKRINEKKLPKE